MSNGVYPVWWDTTITIYNKYEDTQTHLITWFRTVVDTGSFWKYVKDTISINNTVLESKKTICRIRESEKFLEKYVWIGKTTEQKANYFTLGPGDIIVKGTVTDAINEYAVGSRSSDLLTKYRALQGCMEIDLVSLNVGPGRCEPHYRVEGN